MDVVNIGISSIIGGAAGAVIYQIVRNYAMTRRINDMDIRLTSLTNVVRGEKGNESQRRTRDEEQAAIQEGIGLITSGQPIQDVVKQLAIKYPNAAQSLLKKFGGGL